MFFATLMTFNIFCLAGNGGHIHPLICHKYTLVPCYVAGPGLGNGNTVIDKMDMASATKIYRIGGKTCIYK